MKDQPRAALFDHLLPYLTVERVMEFVDTQPGAEHYLPDEPDLAKVPKQWIVNICTAVIGADFKAWVAE